MSDKKFNRRFRPFPNQMKGTFCEIPVEGKSRFIEINHIKYNEQDFIRLVRIDCLEDSLLGQYIHLIGKENIDRSTNFLYKIQTYLADSSIKDGWDFNESIHEYKQYGFADFDKLLDFCNKKWNIQMNDFKPQSETSIPE